MSCFSSCCHRPWDDAADPVNAFCGRRRRLSSNAGIGDILLAWPSGLASPTPGLDRHLPPRGHATFQFLAPLEMFGLPSVRH
jgi:hypothetical protein